MPLLQTNVSLSGIKPAAFLFIVKTNVSLSSVRTDVFLNGHFIFPIHVIFLYKIYVFVHMCFAM